MKILITGGLGYIGSHLAQSLSRDRGHQIKILSLNIPPLFESWKEKHEIIQADITREDEIRRGCRDCDAVIHLASLDKQESQRDPRRALEVSIWGTRNILEEAVRNKVKRFIYFSTIHVYGIPQDEKIDENSPINPLTDYSLARYAGELYCRQFRELHNLNAIVLRPSNGYGAPVHKDVDRWAEVVHDFSRSAFRRKKIVMESEGSQRRDFVPISDIIQGTLLLLKAESSKIRYDTYNLGSGLNFSIREVASSVKNAYQNLYGEEIQIEFAPDIISADIKKPFIYDISRMNKLGFRPRGPEALEEEIEKIFRLLET